MLEIKNVGYTWMALCNQLTSLPFKWLTSHSTHNGSFWRRMDDIQTSLSINGSKF